VCVDRTNGLINRCNDVFFGPLYPFAVILYTNIHAYKTSCRASFLRRRVPVLVHVCVRLDRYLFVGASQHLTGAQTTGDAIKLKCAHFYTHKGADALFWCSLALRAQRCLVLRSCATPPVILPSASRAPQPFMSAWLVMRADGKR